MTEQSTDLTQVTDEQLETQVTDLSKKEDKTAEDNTQLETLKTERQSRYQKRIDKLSGKAKYAEDQLATEREAREKAEKDLAEARAVQTPVKPIQDTVTIEGKAHYTDAALTQMVQSKQISENDAYGMQQARMTAEITANVRNDLTKSEKETQEAKLRADDKAKVLSEYPQFNNQHPDFDPKNELYQLTNEIYSNGYAAKPDGLSKAIKLAKRTLGITSKTLDLSNEFGIQNSSQASDPNKTEKEIVFSENEKDDAIRVWTNVLNPLTNRNYTENEAVEKAKKAKRGRRK